MIQPHEIIATVSIVEFNIGGTENPDWQPTVLDCQDLDWLIRSSDDFNLCHRPILLTEKILTEWCGLRKYLFNQYRIGDRLIVIRYGKFVDYGSSVELPYLHILQRFILALTNEPLKITLK